MRAPVQLLPAHLCNLEHDVLKTVLVAQSNLRVPPLCLNMGQTQPDAKTLNNDNGVLGTLLFQPQRRTPLNRLTFGGELLTRPPFSLSHGGMYTYLADREYVR